MSSAPHELHAAPASVAISRVRVSPQILLAGIVSISFALRLATSLRHAVPRYFPDEYIYSSLARSLAAGRLDIRGTPAHFPALLEPILAAPIWLVADVGDAYRLTQALHGLAVSLAAVPAYWLARRLGLPAWQALCGAAFAVALPALMYSSFVTADAVAYPLVLAAVAAGVAALDSSSRKAQVAFVSFAALAAFGRIQYIVIPAAFAVAAVATTGLRPRALLARTPIVWVSLATPVVLAIAVGPGRVLGYYRSILDFSFDPPRFVHWIVVDLFLLAFAGGWVLLPGAVAGLWLAARRPLVPAERAFAAIVGGLAALLLVEAALYATNGSARFQERYLFALLPFLPIAFALGARRLPGLRHGVALAALGMLLLAARFPVSAYTELDDKQDSPFLMGVARLQELTTVGNGTLIIAAVAGGLSLLAAVAAYRPRFGTPAALVAAVAVTGAMSVAAASFDILHAAQMRSTFSDSTGAVSWIDKYRLTNVAMLVTAGTHRPVASSHLFWNDSVTRLLRLPGAPPVDAFGDELAAVSARGALLAAGKPVTSPILVEEYYGIGILSDARLVERTPSASLWVPRHDARLAAFLAGRNLDGWVDGRSTITVWPKLNGPRAGEIAFQLSLPAEETSGTKISIHAPGYGRQIALRPGDSISVRVPFRATTTPVRITMNATEALSDGMRIVAGKMSVPRLVETNP